MPDKPRIDTSKNNTLTSSGVVPKWDGTYFFDDPDLYFDQLYPANVEYTQGSGAKLVADTHIGEIDVQLEVERVKSSRIY